MIRIAAAYPDLLNLYGDYMNAAVLARYLRDAGQPAETVSFSIGSYIDLGSVDFLFIGAGTERRMLTALRDFRRFFSELRRFAEADGLLLSTGSSVCLLGRGVKDVSGNRTEGAGILDMDAAIIPKRRYAEFILSFDNTDRPVIGSINSSLDISWRGAPFFKVTGQSGGEKREAEGAFAGGVFATELSGPLLLRNPYLLHHFAERAAARKLPEGESEWFKNALAGYRNALDTLTKEL